MGETISVRLGEISGLEALREVNVRARDLKPVFAAIKASGFFHDPNNYSRPDRLLGEVATEHMAEIQRIKNVVSVRQVTL